MIAEDWKDEGAEKVSGNFSRFVLIPVEGAMRL
jgi:hypothetical protein